MAVKGAAASIMTIALILLASSAAGAAVLRQSCEFQMETWCDVNQTDGPITIHRFRVTASDAGIRSISAANVLNDEYLQRVSVQVEFTNEGGRKYKSYIKVRWLDGEETAIDGFGDEEGLEANRSRGMIRRSIGALKYGLQKAKHLELEAEVRP